MTLKITKEEFLLLMEMYQQGQQMMIIKKHEKIDVPESYTVDKYINLLTKIFEQASNQKISDEELDKTSEDFLNVVNKMNKTKEEKNELMNLYMAEMLNNKMWRDTALDIIHTFLDSEEEGQILQNEWEKYKPEDLLK